MTSFYKFAKLILICKSFCVDKKGMEFINCSYSYAPEYKKSYKPYSRAVKAKNARFAQKAFLERKSVLSFHQIFAVFKGEISLAAKNLRSLKKYAYLLPVFAFFAAIPFFTVKIALKSESFAKKIDLSSGFFSESEAVELAMNEFAFQSSWFDSEGNVVTENGLSSSQEIFKDSIKYETYTVKAGDTISGISAKFGLSNISTLIAVNDIKNVRALKSGTKLQIPSMDGLFHTVKSGESLASISVKYQVPVEDLLDVNDLTSDLLLAGQKIFIPGARLDSDSLLKAMGEVFVYPIASGWHFSSMFGARKDPITGVDSRHTGVDMAAPKGTAVTASKSGVVSYTGFSNIFGNYVIINHSDGYQTLYGHMSKILTKKGARVNQGTKIGLVGSTGYSTGNHLHFTVYKNGRIIDPMTVLKK